MASFYYLWVVDVLVMFDMYIPKQLLYYDWNEMVVKSVKAFE